MSIDIAFDSAMEKPLQIKQSRMIQFLKMIPGLNLDRWLTCEYREKTADKDSVKKYQCMNVLWNLLQRVVVLM